MQSLFEGNPVIAAVRDDDSLAAACASGAAIVFMLYGSINNVAENTARLKKSGKRVFIHVDLIDGLKADKQGIGYIAREAKPYGIITTKPINIKHAFEYGLKGVLRIFLIDSSAFMSGLAGIRVASPTFVEIMPGLLGDAIKELKKRTDVPIVAGGMIKTRVQAERALECGAVACSTTARELWK